MTQKPKTYRTRPIGERFKYTTKDKGVVTLEVVDSESLKCNCCFDCLVHYICECELKKNVTGECYYGNRSDGKNVYFKEVKDGVKQ